MFVIRYVCFFFVDLSILELIRSSIRIRCFYFVSLLTQLTFLAAFGVYAASNIDHSMNYSVFNNFRKGKSLSFVSSWHAERVRAISIELTKKWRALYLVSPASRLGAIPQKFPTEPKPLNRETKKGREKYGRAETECWARWETRWEA